jgi:hypothetical protein
MMKYDDWERNSFKDCIYSNQFSFVLSIFISRNCSIKNKFFAFVIGFFAFRLNFQNASDKKLILNKVVLNKNIK